MEQSRRNHMEKLRRVKESLKKEKKETFKRSNSLKKLVHPNLRNHPLYFKLGEKRQDMKQQRNKRKTMEESILEEMILKFKPVEPLEMIEIKFKHLKKNTTYNVVAVEQNRHILIVEDSSEIYMLVKMPACVPLPPPIKKGGKMFLIRNNHKIEWGFK